MVLRNLSRFSFSFLNNSRFVSARAFSSLCKDQKTTERPREIERSLGKVNEEMDFELVNLSNSLTRIIGGKAHPGYFNSVYVYSFMEWVPLHSAAQVTTSSDTDLKIESYEPSNAPMIEKALQKTGLKLQITRDFGVIHVKLLDNNKESYLEQISTQVTRARQAIEDVQLEAAYKLKGFPIQLSKLELITSQKIKAAEELGEMRRGEL